MPVEHAARIDVEAVGHAGHIVGPLQIAVAIGNDEFTAFFEVGQCLSYFFQRGHVGTEYAAFKVDARDFVAGGSDFDGFQDVVKALLFRARHAEEYADGILLYAFLQIAREVDA